MNPFFDLLFDPGEASCFADNPKGTRVLPISFFDARRHEYFSINPLDAQKDNDPHAPYHHPLKPRRADANVSAYRNLLVEMDRLSLPDQLAFVKSMEMPFTSAVYSGGKSYHFIISLKNSLPDRAAYDDLVRRLYSVVSEHVDAACKNPSRLSRSPGFLRAEKMKFQSLRELRERVDNQLFEDWLRAHGTEPSPRKAPLHEPLISLNPSPSIELNPSTRAFLSHGAADGKWNQSLFKAACDSFSKGWDHASFIDEALQITGQLDKNDQATIRSAWLTVRRKVS